MPDDAQRIDDLAVRLAEYQQTALRHAEEAVEAFQAGDLDRAALEMLDAYHAQEDGTAELVCMEDVIKRAREANNAD